MRDTSLYEGGVPILTEDFDYTTLDQQSAEQPDSEGQSTLTNILSFLGGDGSLVDIERRSIYFLNFVVDRTLLRPSLRVSTAGYVEPEWRSSLVAQRLADYLLECRYRSELVLRAVILLWNFSPFLLSCDVSSQVQLAEWIGVGKSAVSKTQSKLESFFDISTSKRNKKRNQ